MREAIVAYRYLCELQQTEDALKKNEEEFIPREDFLKKVKIQIKNSRKRKENKKLENLKARCAENIKKQKEKCKTFDATKIDDVALGKMFEEFFKKDKYDWQKTYEAIVLSLQSENDRGYVYESESSLRNVSKILFGDADRCERIKKNFEKNYKNIFTGEDTVKDFLRGAGTALAVFSVFVPILAGIGAGSSGMVAGVLGQFGHQAAKVAVPGIVKLTGITIVSSVLIFGGLAMAENVIQKAIDDKKFKESLRELTVNDLAAILAIKTTLLQECRSKMMEDEFKETIDEALRALDAVRSDAEYAMIAEREDVDENIQKIEMCHRYVLNLAKIKA